MPTLQLLQCPPSERAAQILELFTRAGQPEFQGIFDRAYRVREAHGLRSWLGLSDELAVLHISLSPLTFSDGTSTLTGGFLGDLMADETQRDFWGPLKLVRQLVGDVKKAGRVDFILTTHMPAAVPVFKAAGFAPCGVLRRQVMPTLWPWRLMARVKHRQRVPPFEELPFGDARVEPLFAQLPSPGHFRPVPERPFYGTRIPRPSYPAGTWLVMGEREHPEALVLVTPGNGECNVVDVLWRDASTPLEGVLTATCGWAARHGFPRLSISVMEGSRFEDVVRRAGFLRRPDGMDLMMWQSGGRPVAPTRDWFLTPFAGTSW